MGRSGCGKTTLLRGIAGFEAIEQGVIELNNRIIHSPKKQIDVSKRKISMTFQDYALFPHLNVWKNICFSRSLFKRKAKNYLKEIEKLMEAMDLAKHKYSYPHELSGGQKQRVALLRSLFSESDLIMLDEPFSNQDEELKEVLIDVLIAFIRKHEKTVLITTHNQQEAFGYSDKIGIFNQGRIEQWGNAQQVYDHPKTPYVAGFLGNSKLLQARVMGENRIECVFGEIEIESEDLKGVDASQLVKVLFRSTDFNVNSKGKFKATVISKKFLGVSVVLHLQFTNEDSALDSSLDKELIIPVLCDKDCDCQVNEVVGFDLKTKNQTIFH